MYVEGGTLTDPPLNLDREGEFLRVSMRAHQKRYTTTSIELAMYKLICIALLR